MLQWVNRLGNGGPLAVITLIIALTVARRRRTLWPVAPVVAAFLAIGFVIMPLKQYFHRAAPHSVLPDDVEVRLFSQPGFGLSYPSGHAVNTIVWYGVIALLLAGWFAARPAWHRALRIAPPIIVGFTATYLGWHWLTDMVAGLFLGVLIDRVLMRVSWPGLTEPARPELVGSDVRP
ncbi:phosphatase PAP2 family protein [Luedemannella flava]